MPKAVLLIGLVWGCFAAHAAQRITVAELRQVLFQQRVNHERDEEAATQLGSVELSERLTASTLTQLNTEFKPGEKTAKQLDVLADVSALLDPPASELPRMSPPSAAEQQKILDAAKKFATATLNHLPDFLANRTTWSFEDVPVLTADISTQSGMHPVGESSAEVAYRGGLEFASKTASLAGSHRGPLPNLSSAGEFGPVLATIVTDSAQGKVAWSYWEQTAEGMAGVFRYEVPKQAAHYTIEFCCGRDTASDREISYRGRPAYRGTMMVNPSTGAILRVTIEADIDAFDPVQHFGLMVEYGQVEISGSSLICPRRSAVIFRAVAMARKRTWDVIHVNDVMFSDYRRFGSTARIVSGAAR